MFEQACNEHMRQFDDPFEEELEDDEEEEEEVECDRKMRRNETNADGSDRSDDGEEEEEEEDEDGWRERKLTILPKGPAVSPNMTAVAGSSEEDEDDVEDEEELRVRTGGGDGISRSLAQPKIDNSSEDSSDEDLDSPAIVRSSHPKSNFPDLGNLLVTRGEAYSIKI